jgi:hypothetical protein
MTDKLENYTVTLITVSDGHLHIKESEELTEQETELLVKSDVILYATLDTFACISRRQEHILVVWQSMNTHVGSLRENTMEEVWRDKPMQQMRKNMLKTSLVWNALSVMNKKSQGSLVCETQVTKHLGITLRKH